MSVNLSTISRWFDSGVEDNKTHMFVVCDTFSNEHHPVYIEQGQNARNIYNAKHNHNMQRVIEVYDMSLDRDMQLSEERAFHLPK